MNYLQEVNDLILNPKKKDLINILVDFIKNETQLLISESARDNYKLKVVTFEFDTPFSFSYVAYPGSNLIPNEYVTTNTDFKLKTHWDELKQIFKDKGFIQGPDGDEWFNTETFDLISEWKLCRYMECHWFSDCWKEAKQIANRKDFKYLDLRCFFVEHDVFGGIDADQGRFKSEEEIITTLKNEKLYIEPEYETQWRVYKKGDKKATQYWKAELQESFGMIEPAFRLLKKLVNESGDEFAHEDFFITKWKKWSDNNNRDWFNDSSFKRKFLEAKTAKGFLYTKEEFEKLEDKSEFEKQSKNDLIIENKKYEIDPEKIKEKPNLKPVKKVNKKKWWKI